jgi:antitoxin CptB
MSEKSRLRWKCRRGMKELDDLLSRFLEMEFDGLSEQRQQAFLAVLEMEDPDLYACVLGQQQAPTAEMQDVIAAIRG